MVVMPPVVFFGNERLVSGLPQSDAPVLNGLIKAGYDVVAVVSHHSDSKSRNQRPLEVAEIAAQHNIPVLTPEKPIEIIDHLRSLGAPIAVLSAYGRIIPQSVIDVFPLGIINIHPSLLPRYRGPTPIESTILSGDAQAGVSIMQLTAAMDAGGVYGQVSLPLDGSEDKFALYRALSIRGAELLLELLPRIINGSLQPTPQDDQRAVYCQLLTKSDGILDPTKQSAVQAERQVRAYLGYPKTRLTLFEQQIIVTKAHVSSTNDSPMAVQFNDGNYLIIDKLIAPSGKAMSGAAFTNGYGPS